MASIRKYKQIELLFDIWLTWAVGNSTRDVGAITKVGVHGLRGTLTEYREERFMHFVRRWNTYWRDKTLRMMRKGQSLNVK